MQMSTPDFAYGLVVMDLQGRAALRSVILTLSACPILASVRHRLVELG